MEVTNSQFLASSQSVLDASSSTSIPLCNSNILWTPMLALNCNIAPSIFMQVCVIVAYRSHDILCCFLHDRRQFPLPLHIYPFGLLWTLLPCKYKLASFREEVAFFKYNYFDYFNKSTLTIFYGNPSVDFAYFLQILPYNSCGNFPSSL